MTLTRDERLRREEAAERADEAAFNKHTLALVTEHVMRLTAADDEPAVDPATVRGALLPALRSALDDGQRLLVNRLREEGLDYDVARIGAEYTGTAVAWMRAVGAFRPTPPLTARDATALAATFPAEVGLIVTALIEDAVAARNVTQLRASRWLGDWTKRRRRVPEDEQAADRRDDARIEELLPPPPELAAVEVTPGTEADREAFAGARGHVFRVHYPAPTGNEEF
jgi:hypothetical protein